MQAGNHRIAVISLGCAKNLVNTEQMVFLLSNAGYELSGETIGADTVIVNTCAFIESAKMESIEAILELGQAKEDGKIGRIVVAGCLPQRYRTEILRGMPEIDVVLGTGSFDKIVSAIEPIKGTIRTREWFGDINAPVSETRRVLMTPKSWAYLKIAEGCDNRCAYCSIPGIRGRFRSRPIENIVKEANELADFGVRELILVAQDTTRFGLDLYGERALTELLNELSQIEKLKWIRLHYLYPDDIDDKLIDVIAKSDKILKYIDVPIQHISDSVLQRMNRRGGSKVIKSLVRDLRERVPDVVIRTSIITGLPGEGRSEFEELCDFLREVRIERTGVFTYSPEEGTNAAMMPCPDPETAARRKELLEDIQSQIMDDFCESRIGSETEVLVEGECEGHTYGRSYAESPDIDGYVLIEGNSFLAGEFIRVRITGMMNNEPVGEKI